VNCVFLKKYLIAAGSVLFTLGLCTGAELPPRLGTGQGLTVTDLRCEYRNDPLGVDVAQPRLGWKIETGNLKLETGIRGMRQSAYQILVASSEEVLKTDKGDVWDSGKVLGAAQNQIAYGGATLASHQQVFWKVRVWDGAATPSAWSVSATWTMGVLNAKDWQAQWITFGSADAGSTLLRRGFEVRPGLKRALVNVCGLGQYEMSLNNAKVGSGFLSPGWTKYDKTVLYDTLDVTSLLRAGTHAIGLLLGNGMYNVPDGKGRYVKFVGSFGPRKAIAQLRLEYTDGAVQVLGTDASWKAAANGPVTFNTIYGGEDYDARLEQPGWDTAAFDDSAWPNALLTNGPGGALKGLSCAAPPLRTQQVFKPASSWPKGDATRIYDFGQNAAMIPTLVLHGPAGSSVKIYTSELIHQDGSLNAIVGNSFMTYTLKGGGAETFTPRFYYMGYRYLRVELRDASGGTGGELPVLDSIASTAVSSASEQVGSFACSNDLFNRIRTLIQWAQRNNSVSVISDCPQREKLGWLEQYHLHGPSLRYEQNYAALYAKGESDMADSQLPTGLVPDIAPEYLVFDGGLRDSPEWGSSCVLVPWQQYEFYGDTELLGRYYGVMKRYVDYLTGKSSGHMLDHGLGDWYDMGPGGLGEAQLTPKSLTATAIYYADVQVMAQAAALLGKPADAAVYSTLASNIYAAFNAKFYNAAAGSYSTGSQTANAMPLVLGLVAEKNRARVVKALVEDVRSRGYSLTAGDVGHRFLLRALADAGRSDVIYDLHSKTNTPGYGYILNRGATSLTEGWDGSESQNHFMLGHIMEWFYHDLAGIQPDPAAPGFKKIVIKPTVVGDVTWAKAGYQSMNGMISNHWERVGNQMTMCVAIPAGTTATVWLPLLGSNLSKLVVTEGDAVIWRNGKAREGSPGVEFKRVESGSPLQHYMVWSVGSGHYRFQWTVAPAPAGLAATPGHAQVGLQWNAALSATGYHVKRALRTGGPYTVIAKNCTDTRYTDRTAKNGTTYYYAVTAARESGESSDSVEVRATPAFVLDSSFETPRVRNYKHNPPGAAWMFSGRSGVSANGTDMTARNPNAPLGNQVAFLQSGGTLSQVLSDLTPGTPYQLTFAVAQQAHQGAAQSWSVQMDGKALWTFGPVGTTYTDFYTDYSVLFTATAENHTLAFVGPATGDDIVFLDDVRVAAIRGKATLTAPARLKASVVASSRVKLEWTASPGASAYHVKRSAIDGGPYTTIATNVSPTTYTSCGLSSGVKYCYVVTAVNSAGESANSAQVSATPTGEADNMLGDWSFLDAHNPGWIIEKGWGRNSTPTPAGMRVGTVGAKPPEGMINVAAPAGLSFTNAGVEMLFTAHDQGVATRSYMTVRDRDGKGLALGTLSGKLFLQEWGNEPPGRNVDASAFVDGRQHALALVWLDDGTVHVYLDGSLMDSRKTPLPSTAPATIGIGMELGGGWYIPYGTVVERVRAFRFASGAFNPKQLLKPIRIEASQIDLIQSQQRKGYQ